MKFLSLHDAMNYAFAHSESRCPEAEEMLLTFQIFAFNNDDWDYEQVANYAYAYAMNVIKGRWLEAERILKRRPGWWRHYKWFLYDQITEEVPKYKAFIDASETDDDFEILQSLPLTRYWQEYICQTKPHLIGKIRDLEPELAKKCRHELELSRVDL